LSFRRPALERFVDEMSEARDPERASEPETQPDERAEPAAPAGDSGMPLISKLRQLEERIEKLEEIAKARGSFEF
jgi:hypothetical protein